MNYRKLVNKHSLNINLRLHQDYRKNIVVNLTVIKGK